MSPSTGDRCRHAEAAAKQDLGSLRLETPEVAIEIPRSVRGFAGAARHAAAATLPLLHPCREEWSVFLCCRSPCRGIAFSASHPSHWYPGFPLFLRGLNVTLPDLVRRSPFPVSGREARLRSFHFGLPECPTRFKGCLLGPGRRLRAWAGFVRFVSQVFRRGLRVRAFQGCSWSVFSWFSFRCDLWCWFGCGLESGRVLAVLRASDLPVLRFR